MTREYDACCSDVEVVTLAIYRVELKPLSHATIDGPSIAQCRGIIAGLFACF